MIPSEYETIIQMLLNEVIRLRRENDNSFRNALAEASFRRNPTTGTAQIISNMKPIGMGPRTKAANQHGRMVEGTWMPNKIKTPKRGKFGRFSK